MSCSSATNPSLADHCSGQARFISQGTKLLETIVAWGRYAELIDFDQNSNTVHLHEGSAAEEDDEEQSSGDRG